MIPRDFITEWREFAPWEQQYQVEQDLIISRALVEIYSNEFLRSRLAFRGGTALHKLHFSKSGRYSEDLDFVQMVAEPIGKVFDTLREILDPWLGQPRRVTKEGLVKLTYQYQSEDEPSIPMKLKIEINSRDHFSTLKTYSLPVAISSRWYRGEAPVTTLPIDWLLGSKLKALYQRRKGRDLYDLWLALEEKLIEGHEIIEPFERHLTGEKVSISRAQFEENMFHKLNDPIFTGDLSPLLSANFKTFRFDDAYKVVHERIIGKISGEPWKIPVGKEPKK